MSEGEALCQKTEVFMILAMHPLVNKKRLFGKSSHDRGRRIRTLNQGQQFHTAWIASRGIAAHHVVLCIQFQKVEYCSRFLGGIGGVQHCASCIPFDEMARVGWGFEDAAHTA